MSELRIGIVVVHWRGMADTGECLASIGALTPPAAGVALVVNGPGDFAEAEARAACPSTEVIALDRNLGYAAGCNAGARALFDRGCDAALLLNNDVVVEADTLAAIAALFEAQPRAGIVGLPIVYEDDRSLVWFAGGRVNRWLGYTRHDGFRSHTLPGQPRRVDFVTGAALCVRREAYGRLGGLDERYFHYFEDADLCSRANARGYECWMAPRPPVRHKVSASAGERGSNNLNREQAHYFARNRMRWVRETFAPPQRYTALAAQIPLLAYESVKALLQRNPTEARGRIEGVVAGLRGESGQRGAR